MKLRVLTLATMIFIIGCEEILDVDATSMTIESVTLEKMPFKNSYNLDWDELSGPDIYIRFEETSITGGIETGINQDISPADLPLTWDVSFSLDDFSNNLEVYIYDADVLSDDLIDGGEFEFDPSDTPSTWTLDISDDLQLTIDVTYEF